MEYSDIDFDDSSYRRVPVNSATTQRDATDRTTIITYSSTQNIWGRPLKRPVTTKNLDATLLGRCSHTETFKDLFPRGKSRQRSTNSAEMRSNPRGAYMSLLPVDPCVVHPRRPPSPLSIATGKQASSLPEVSRKITSWQSKRFTSAAVIDENSDSKLYARRATTVASGAWVRRYKSINASQTFTDLLRDDSYRDKLLFKKSSYQQLFNLSSSSPLSLSVNASLIKSKRNAA